MKDKGRKTFHSYGVGYIFPKGCDTPLNVRNHTPIFRSDAQPKCV